MEQQKPIVVCVSSGKGGVGKTTITVNLAMAWARTGRRVLLVDGDLGLANVDLLLGVQTQTTIRHALESDHPVESCIVQVNDHLSILPAASGVPEMVSLGPEDLQRLGRAIDSISETYPLVVIDTAAGIGESVVWFNQLANANLLIVTPDPTAMTDAYALMKVLSQRHGRNRMHVVVNQANTSDEGDHVFDHLNRVAEQFLRVRMTHLGTLTTDTIVAQAVREQSPFVVQWPTTSAAKAMMTMADKLYGELTQTTE